MSKIDEAYESALSAAKSNAGSLAEAKAAGLVRTDRKHKLWYRKEGSGYSGLGFEYATREVRAASEITGRTYDYEAILSGSPKGFLVWVKAMEEAREVHFQTKRRAEGLLSPQLKGLEGKRVEVVTKYGETRRFIVGKSMGWMPIHLEIARRSSHGGAGADFEYKSVRVIPGGR